jgi:hypothetical protein
MQNRTTISTARRTFLGFLESLVSPTLFLTHREFSTLKTTPRLLQAF